MNAYDSYVNLAMESVKLEMERRRTWEKWRQECNAQGLEIFYDMSDAVERGVGCDCDEDCGESHVIKVGRYNTRPCAQHFEGHQCNPPLYARITGLSVTNLSL